jgi:hypothetical protein
MKVQALETEFRLSWVDYLGIALLIFALIVGALAMSKLAPPGGRPIP